MAAKNAVNVLQEIPKLRRTKDKLAYDLNGLALSYLQNKTDSMSNRLQAIEEMLSAIYLRLDEMSPKDIEPEAIVDETPLPRRRRPLVDSLDGTFVPSQEALSIADNGSPKGKYENLPWWQKIYIRLFYPEQMRQHPPYEEESSS